MKSGTKITSTLAAPVILLIAYMLPTRAAAAPPDAQGPCDIYAAANTPCVAAHSTTRSLYASYNGPLYQIKRESDGRTLDIGVVRGTGTGMGGYANAAAQDRFCANTLCVINVIYDQSGKGNHLFQAPPGTFKGPAKGAFDTQPIADMAPASLDGHKVYGIFIMPGMGFRNNNATGIAIGDEPEGIYYVIDGTHYDSGCCFDYGNSSTNGRAVGRGTMETVYFGTSTVWGSGSGAGPWIMADMEAGLFSGHDAKQNVADPSIDSWRFVTAVAGGGGGNRWDLRGGNAQQGGLKTFYSGERPGPPVGGGYYPMHKQGGILLGTGGDNGNGSSGTFYEGMMTTGLPTEATTDAVQSNIVAARYNVAPIEVSHIVGFTPGSSQEVTATFTNTTGAPVNGLRLGIDPPSASWRSVADGTQEAAKTFADPVAPGASVSATFRITSPAITGAGFLRANAAWKSTTGVAQHTETTTVRVRNIVPVKINELRFGAATNPTDQFVELYNASDRAVDLSGWRLIAAQSQWSPVTVATIPAGTKLPAHRFYLLGLANSGLAAPAKAGTKTIQVRNTTGFAVGQKIEIDGELRAITAIGSAASPMTTVFIPVSTDPRMTFPVGSTRLPVTSAAGFEQGQKIGIDLGGKYEVATVTAVGKAGTQTTLAEAALAGSTSIRIAANSGIAAGDSVTIGTAARAETIRVAGAEGPAIGLALPLKYDHAPGVDVSSVGTGVSFTPATRYLHSAGDGLQALGGGITLDKPLTRTHSYGAPIINPVADAAAYPVTHSPNLRYGSALSAGAGSIALVDSPHAIIVDAVVYGSQQSNSSGNGTIASPELATLVSDQGQGGCIVAVSSGQMAATPGKSWGRYPDGKDTGRICADFHTQAEATFAAASAIGTTNIKVNSVDGFATGQSITIGSGIDQETAMIAAVGTPGAATLNNSTVAGATALSVANTPGFRPGQIITIDTGANAETAAIATIGRRGAPTITLAEPLKNPHAAGVPIAGTGITVSSPLTREHSIGTQFSDSLPTPGAPNQYRAVPK